MTDIAKQESFPAPYEYFGTHNAGNTITVWEAVRATNAAPIYFPPFYLKDREELRDGGIFVNNPSQVAIREARYLWPSTKEKTPDLLLSIGNGYKDQTIKTDPPKRRGGIFFPRLTTLRDSLYENMDFEEMRDTNLGVHPNKLVRLCPRVEKDLPELDKVGDLREGGVLDQIASEYLEEEVTQHRIDSVYRTLISTTFYFNSTEKPYQVDSGEYCVKGLSDS